MSDPIPITGLGVVSPFGDSAERFRDLLIAGATGIAADPRFVAFGCRSRLAARVSGFDAASWIPPMKLRRMDTTGPYALVALRQAMDDARYVVTADGAPRAGVVLGTYSAGGQATNEYLEALFRGGPMGAPALLFNSTVGNAAAGLAGLEFTLRGPNATISQKEASGLAAIVTAVDILRLGRADAMGAGGMDAIFDIFYRAHDRFNAMTAAGSLDGSQAPFSRTRQGFVMGEGAFVLWLERGGAWRDRGSQVRGEILGGGMASANCAVNAWPSDPDSIVRSITIALDDAGLTAADVDVVYASANATRGLDDVEAIALTRLFGGSRAIVTSIKGAIGESGAAGAGACVAALLCGAAGLVPPVAGLGQVDPLAETLRVPATAVRSPGEIVLVNSVASGGALASAVLRVPRARS